MAPSPGRWRCCAACSSSPGPTDDRGAHRVGAGRRGSGQRDGRRDRRGHRLRVGHRPVPGRAVAPQGHRPQGDEGVGGRGRRCQLLVSGTVATVHQGPGDLPMDHPLGDDLSMDVTLDAAFTPFSLKLGAAPSDTKAGQLHVEISSGMIPHLPSTSTPPANQTWRQLSDVSLQGFQPGFDHPAVGDRVLVGGRYIVDCGHPDYHTELHPISFLAWSHQDGHDDGRPRVRQRLLGHGAVQPGLERGRPGQRPGPRGGRQHQAAPEVPHRRGGPAHRGQDQPDTDVRAARRGAADVDELAGLRPGGQHRLASGRPLRHPDPSGRDVHGRRRQHDRLRGDPYVGRRAPSRRRTWRCGPA